MAPLLMSTFLSTSIHGDPEDSHTFNILFISTSVAAAVLMVLELRFIGEAHYNTLISNLYFSVVASDCVKVSSRGARHKDRVKSPV